MLSRLHTHIVVTDRRVDRAGYDAPTPTTVVGQAELQKRNPARVIDLIAEMPHFFNDSNTSSQGSGSTGTGGQSFVNLRALGATRTLVLLDRHRIVPTAATGDRGYFADPESLIMRVNIVPAAHRQPMARRRFAAAAIRPPLRL